MATYNFTKAGINKTYAFEPYLKGNFPLYEDFSYTDPDLSIDTTQALTPSELNDLTTLVNDYVDPPVFLVLNTTITDAAWSKAASTPDLMPVHTFIFSPNSPDGDAVFNGMKTVIEYTTSDITSFSGVTGAAVTFQIFDISRDIPISTTVIDISDIVNEWNVKAGLGATGANTVYRSFLVEGLRTQIATYDCIWQLKFCVNVPNVSVRSHSLQRLYYNLL